MSMKKNNICLIAKAKDPNKTSNSSTNGNSKMNITMFIVHSNTVNIS